jgi:hypothetical protein
MRQAARAHQLRTQARSYRDRSAILRTGVRDGLQAITAPAGKQATPVTRLQARAARLQLRQARTLDAEAARLDAQAARL